MSPEEEHDYLAAEARARKKIDEKLVEVGWKVQDRAKANLYAGQGVALREFVHGQGHGRSDYALYVDRQLVGVLEAKPDGTTLTEVERQTRKYIEGVPDAIPAPVTPLPFGYEATGTEARFTCFSDPEPRSRRMFGGYIHRPETLAKWLARIITNQEAPTVRAGIRAMPALNVEPLWGAQVEAIQNTEQSLRENRPRALIQMATGSGKTYTAATERFKPFTYDELVAREKVSLDIIWMQDESLEDSENLPAPEVIAAELVDELEAALTEFRAVAEMFGNGEPEADLTAVKD